MRSFGLAQGTVSVSRWLLDDLDLCFVLSSFLRPHTPSLQNEGSRPLQKLQGQEWQRLQQNSAFLILASFSWLTAVDLQLQASDLSKGV